MRSAGAAPRRRRPSRAAAAGSSGLPRATAARAGTCRLGSRRNSECRARNRSTCRSFSSGSSEQVEYTSNPPGATDVGCALQQLAPEPFERGQRLGTSPATARRDGGQRCRCRGRAHRAARRPTGGSGGLPAHRPPRRAPGRCRRGARFSADGGPGRGLCRRPIPVPRPLPRAMLFPPGAAQASYTSAPAGRSAYRASSACAGSCTMNSPSA